MRSGPSTDDLFAGGWHAWTDRLSRETQPPSLTSPPLSLISPHLHFSSKLSKPVTVARPRDKQVGGEEDQDTTERAGLLDNTPGILQWRCGGVDMKMTLEDNLANSRKIRNAKGADAAYLHQGFSTLYLWKGSSLLFVFEASWSRPRRDHG